MVITDKPADRAAQIADDRIAGHPAADLDAHGRVDRMLWIPMQIGLALSVVVHVAVILFALDHPAEPFEALPANAITVDIVPSNETENDGRRAPPGPIAPPAPFVSDSANRESVPLSFGPPAAPKPAQPSYASALANMLHVEITPAGESDAPPSESKLQHSSEAVAALKARLQSCWTRPSGGADAKTLKVVIRVSLDRAGRLTREPILVEAPASPAGPAVVANAMRALRQCEPYNFLPADKYDEWKVLDLRFSQSGVS